MPRLRHTLNNAPYPSLDSTYPSGPPTLQRRQYWLPLSPICEQSSDCCGLSAGLTRDIILNRISISSLQSYAMCQRSLPVSLSSTSSCSRAEASCEVEQKRTKYSCWRFRCGKFVFATYTFVWGLYCFVRLPDTSSAHVIMPNVNVGRPLAISLTGCGIFIAHEGDSSDRYMRTYWLQIAAITSHDLPQHWSWHPSSSNSR